MPNIRSNRSCDPSNPPNGYSRKWMMVAGMMTNINLAVQQEQKRELSVQLPLVGKRLNLTQTVPLPATASTVIVINYTVPFGWVGYINNIAHQYINGAGFVDGSGDLIWGIGINNYFPYGYGNMTVQQGSLTNASLYSDTGIRIRSNQNITYQVTWNGQNLVGGSLLCAFQGWVCPVAVGDVNA